MCIITLIPSDKIHFIFEEKLKTTDHNHIDFFQDKGQFASETLVL